MLAPHIELGNQGEELASHFLLARGYQILSRNWRYGHLEIDMVCQFGGQIVFVEVKTRKSAKFGAPAAAITHAKQQKLIRAAHAWLAATEHWNWPCRFDVISIIGVAGRFQMEHYPNAFDSTQALDCSHTNRQYW